MFFNHHKQLIRSKKSRIPAGAADSSDTIRNALYSEYDADFIDFIEVSDLSEFSLVGSMIRKRV